MKNLNGINNQDDKIMTIIYRKRDKFICAICTGKVDITVVATGLEKEDAELVYEKIEKPLDKYVISNSFMFCLDDNLNICLLDEYKNKLNKYI